MKSARRILAVLSEVKVLQSAWILALLCATSAANAGDLYVSPSGDNSTGANWATAFTSLPAALTAASAGDAIHVAGGVYELASPLTWTQAGLTIRGGYEANPAATPGARDPAQWPTAITRAASQAIRLVDLGTLSGATLDGLMFTNGLAQVDGSAAWDARGGAMLAVDVTDLLVTNCVFRQNKAERTTGVTYAYGGAVYLSGGTAHFKDTVFDANQTVAILSHAYGGAVYSTAGTSHEFTRCRVANNTTDSGNGSYYARGAGFAFDSTVSATISDCRFQNNQTLQKTGYGGAVYASDTAGTLTDSVFNGNLSRGGDNTGAPAYGGAVYLSGTTGGWTIQHSVFFGNRSRASSARGTAIYIASGAHALRNLLVTANMGASSGHAAVHIAAGSTVVENASIIGHGRIGLIANTTSTLRNSILFGNQINLSGSPIQANNLIGVDPLLASPHAYLQTGSDAIAAGDRTAGAAGVGDRTSFASGATYANPATDTVNLGYHYPAGLGVDLELWVNPTTGSDANPGTSALPLKTITQAIALAEGRTRVNLATGQYTNLVETFPLMIAEKSVQLVGQGPEQTIIDAAGSNSRVFLFKDSPTGDSRLANLTVCGGYQSAPTGAGNEQPGGGIFSDVCILTLTNVVVRNNTVTDDYDSFGAGLYAFRSSVKGVDLVFSGNVNAGSSSAGRRARGGAVAFDSGVGQFENAIFIGNSLACDDLYGGALALQDGFQRLRNVLVANNIADDTNGNDENRGDGVYVYANALVEIDNATIVGHTASGLQTVATDTVVRNSILYHNRPDIVGTVTQVSSLVGVDPAFEMPHHYLKAMSPALGAGDRTASAAGMAGRTSLLDGGAYAAPATDPVNLGYHFAAGLPTADVECWVDPTLGGDGNSGAQNAPFKTLTKALSLGGKTTRIHLAAGEYTAANETYPLVVERRTLQLIGADAATTLLDGGLTSRLLQFIDSPMGDNRIENLTLRNAKLAVDGAGIHAVNAALSVIGCIVTNNQAYTGVNGARGGGIFAQRCGVVVENSQFLDNLARGGTGAGTAHYGLGGGLYLDGGHVGIDRSLFKGNTSHGTYSSGAAIGMDDGYLEVRNTLVANNTAAYGTKQGAGMRVVEGAVDLENCTLSLNNPEGVRWTFPVTGMRMHNTIAWGNTTADVVGYGTATNLIYHSLAAGLDPTLQGNQDADPLFVDAGSGDFRLQTQHGQFIPGGGTLKSPLTSPAIDAGTNRFWIAAATLDLQGMPRLARGIPGGGVRVDLGVYEITAPLVSTVVVVR